MKKTLLFIVLFFGFFIVLSNSIMNNDKTIYTILSELSDIEPIDFSILQKNIVEFNTSLNASVSNGNIITLPNWLSNTIIALSNTIMTFLNLIELIFYSIEYVFQVVRILLF